MTDLDFSLIDADQHYYEPDDCFTRHLESRFLPGAVEVRHDRPDGLGRVYLAGSRLGYFSVTPGDETGPPGLLRSYFRSEGRSVVLTEQSVHGTSTPEFTQRDVRLRVLDEQGVQATVMLPSLGLGIEHEARHDPQTWYALMRSFNRWVEEDWGYGQDGRIFGLPMQSLIDVDLALVELERLIEAGAKGILMRPGPIYGRSPADPIFDPFWARAQEANLVVAYHLSSFGYTELFSSQWGHQANAATHRHSAFQQLTCQGDRAMADTVGALVLDNLFTRFPQLRILIVELGASWLPPLLKKMDRIWRTATMQWPHGRPSEAPSEIARRHFWVAPYHEENFGKIMAAMGDGHVLLGSDWPHPEGLALPAELADELRALDATQLRAVMRDNTASLLGLAG